MRRRQSSSLFHTSSRGRKCSSDEKVKGQSLKEKEMLYANTKYSMSFKGTVCQCFTCLWRQKKRNHKCIIYI